MELRDIVIINALRKFRGLTIQEAKNSLYEYKKQVKFEDNPGNTAAQRQSYRADALAMYTTLINQCESDFEHTAHRVVRALKAFNEVF